MLLYVEWALGSVVSNNVLQIKSVVCQALLSMLHLSMRQHAASQHVKYCLVHSVLSESNMLLYVEWAHILTFNVSHIERIDLPCLWTTKCYYMWNWLLAVHGVQLFFQCLCVYKSVWVGGWLSCVRVCVYTAPLSPSHTLATAHTDTGADIDFTIGSR
jgi:hypothetical protein